MNVRKATVDDADLIEDLMKRSMKELGEGYYTAEQIASACKYVCVPDLQVIQDGTYFIVEDEGGQAIGCGGWSFRNVLYAGPAPDQKKDTRLNPLKDPARIRAMFVDPNYSGKGIGSLILEASEKAAVSMGFTKGFLGATLSGLPFYKKKGWIEIETEEAKLPDGETIAVVQMIKDLI